MTYVYIISDYDEYGAEDVCATLDRSKIVPMAEENWSKDTTHAKWLKTQIPGLQNLLEKSDEELSLIRDGHNCSNGWGGMQLHVVKLT